MNSMSWNDLLSLDIVLQTPDVAMDICPHKYNNLRQMCN